MRDMAQRDGDLLLPLLVPQRVGVHRQLQRPPRVRPQRLLRTHGPQQQLRLPLAPLRLRAALGPRSALGGDRVVPLPLKPAPH